MIFSNNILYDFILVNLLYLCMACIYRCMYTFHFFYFEITKHLEGIFIVFATEVACLFKLFYSELHIYSAYISICLYAFLKKRSWFDTDPFCVNENKKNVRSLLIKENTQMKNRVKIYENCQEENIFFYGKIFAVLYTRKSNDTTEDFMREMFLEFLFLYCACEIWC